MRLPLQRSSLCAGFTVAELVLAIAFAGLLVLVAIPRFVHARDVWAVQSGAAIVTRAMAESRHLAGQRGRRTALHLDTTRATLLVVAGSDTLNRHDLQDLFGVRLTASRDSIAWSPSGLGFGAANSRVVVRRGAAAETITVSRLGRVQR